MRIKYVLKYNVAYENVEVNRYEADKVNLTNEIKQECEIMFGDIVSVDDILEYTVNKTECIEEMLILITFDSDNLNQCILKIHEITGIPIIDIKSHIDFLNS